MSRTASLPSFAARRRGGFTLIEIMVVIGIILVLVAVSIAGISQVAKHSKAQRTQTVLETARSLLAGYVAFDKTQAQLKTLYSTATVPMLPGFASASDLDNSNGSLTTGTLAAAKGVNGITKWSAIAANGDVNVPRSIDFTVQAMQILLRVPENREIMNKLPAEAKFVLVDDNGVPLTTAVPLLADGNGEPILFVPPAGLSKVKVTGNGAAGTEGIVQSDTRWHPSVTGSVDPTPNITRTPFFASAGSDRDFTTGDDNAYSTHQ